MSSSAPPPPRAALASVPVYVPGKPAVAGDGRRVYKLSSNENPYPPLPGVLEAVGDAVGLMNRYPDMGCSELYAALAEHLGVAPEQLAAGTGSVAVLYHLLQAYCDAGDEVVYAWRSFEAYPIAVNVTGATAVPVPLLADARHDLEAMLAAVTSSTKVVLVCTPNNPTGPAAGHDDVAAFIARVPADVLVVLDEAYLEFVRSEDRLDALSLIAAHPNVVALRTFSKAYGLAGLRVGYLVGHPEIAAAVRACSLPFGVSTAAQVAAIASLAAEPALFERVELLVGERARVLGALADQGWQLPEAQGNFVWLALGPRTAEFAAAAQDAGIVVRAFADDGVRVTIAEPAANDLLIEVASRFRP